MTELAVPTWLAALVVVPIVALTIWFGRRAALAGARRMFGESRTRRVIAPGLRAACTLLALAGIALALARPRQPGAEIELQSRGRDVAFLVDVSRSMLADDLKPTRLDRARLWIRDVVSILGGDRVGLVAFAGSTVVKCPLTLDYAFFDSALDDLSPTSVARGGTYVGDAIRRTIDDVFDDDPTRYRDIVLISDGEDHESFPAQAAAVAREHGVRIIAIAVGSASGSLIDVPRNDVTGQEQVRTRMEAQTLRDVAMSSRDGVFLEVGTGDIELDEVYRQLILSAAKSDTGASTVRTYREFFQAPLLVSLALLLVQGVIRETI